MYCANSKTRNISYIDYIKLIEDICDRLELEKDYYIEKYNAGELTIFADVFDKYMGDLSEYEGAELEFFRPLFCVPSFFVCAVCNDCPISQF